MNYRVQIPITVYHDVVDQFQDEVLKAHNKYRFIHGVRPLILDPTLCQLSQENAEHLVKFGNENDVKFPNFGENIYTMLRKYPGREPTGDIPVQIWYNQRYLPDYEFHKRERFNFTQVVWKKSKLLGVGRASVDNKLVVSCFYKPAGNVAGEFITNVFPPIDEGDIWADIYF